MIVPYTLAELKAGFRAIIRGGSYTSSLDTGPQSDSGVMGEVVSLMWQGMQVAAVYAYNQLVPATADQTNIERMQRLHGTVRTRPATKARGRLVLMDLNSASGADTEVVAGTVMTTTSFFQGEELVRNLVLTTTCNAVLPAWTGKTVGFGSTSRCIFVRPDVDGIAVGDVISVGGGGVLYVREVDYDADAFYPFAWTGTLPAEPTAGATLTAERGGIAEWESDVAGLAGYAPPYASIDLTDYPGLQYGFVLDCGGMGDEIPLDEAYDLKHLEDEIAGHAGHANHQHYRELALACPDVQLDDAFVYSGVRGPGSVDVVCVGRSGGFSFERAPDLELRHFIGGYRFIGDVAARKVAEWMKGKTPYLADVRVLAMEPDFSGPDRDDGTETTNWNTGIEAVVYVTPMPGYEGDTFPTDTAFTFDAILPIGDETFARRVFDSTPAGIRSDIAVGQRILIAQPYIGSLTAGRAPYFSRVVTITNIDPVDREWFDVDQPLFGGVTGSVSGYWFPAGPLTQPCLTAIHDMFDAMGPGSFPTRPVSVAYANELGVTAPFNDIDRQDAMVRWPPEDRRMPSSYRASEIVRAVSAVPGVRSVRVTGLFGEFADYDPMPFQRLSPRGVIVVYGW